METLTQSELKKMQALTKLDQVLYDTALKLFFDRASVAEASLGFRFVNCNIPL